MITSVGGDRPGPWEDAAAGAAAGSALGGDDRMAGTRGVMSRGTDGTVPSVARMYDYALGGKENRAADREAFHRLEELAPSTRALALNNRRFLTRVVRILAEEYGVRQFLDLGSGLPTEENVHQVARRSAGDARVVYVDHDPLAVAHGRELLGDDPHTAFLHADFRDLDVVLGHPETARLIDWAQPVAVLMVSVLHCVPDEDDPAGLVRSVADRLPAGGFLAANQLVSEDPAVRSGLTAHLLEVTGGAWGRVRSPEEVRAFFAGLDVLPPGLVEISTWRPDTELAPCQRSDEWVEFGGVARRR
jgi:SAM-dependent methyltransferase